MKMGSAVWKIGKVGVIMGAGALLALNWSSPSMLHARAGASILGQSAVMAAQSAQRSAERAISNAAPQARRADAKAEALWRSGSAKAQALWRDGAAGASKLGAQALDLGKAGLAAGQVGMERAAVVMDSGALAQKRLALGEGALSAEERARMDRGLPAAQEPAASGARQAERRARQEAARGALWRHAAGSPAQPRAHANRDEDGAVADLMALARKARKEDALGAGLRPLEAKRWEGEWAKSAWRLASGTDARDALPSAEAMRAAGLGVGPAPGPSEQMLPLLLRAESGAFGEKGALGRVASRTVNHQIQQQRSGASAEPEPAPRRPKAS